MISTYDVKHLIKEAFIAGYLADLQHGEASREEAERAYREWNDRQRKAS